MSSKLRYASSLAVAVTFATTLISAGSGAAAQSLDAPAISQPTLNVVSAPLPAAPAAAASSASVPGPVVEPASPERLSREMQCLAGAIYFEAKGESLEGQLAVGRVVVARSRSGRFPGSYCGVVYQPSQFSFIRGRHMPAINTASPSWANAVRMADLADAGSRKTRAEGALFFHAARVSPNWRLTRLARIDNHIFYR